MACNRPEIPESEIIEVVRIEGGIALMGEVGSALGGPLVDGPRARRRHLGVVQGMIISCWMAPGILSPSKGSEFWFRRRSPKLRPNHTIRSWRSARSPETIGLSRPSQGNGRSQLNSSFLDDRGLHLLNDFVRKVVHAMCIRGVLRRRLKDLLLGLTPYGSLAARHDIGAVELVSHRYPLQVVSWLHTRPYANDSHIGSES